MGKAYRHPSPFFIIERDIIKAIVRVAEDAVHEAVMGEEGKVSVGRPIRSRRVAVERSDDVCDGWEKVEVRRGAVRARVVRLELNLVDMQATILHRCRR